MNPAFERADIVSLAASEISMVNTESIHEVTAATRDRWASLKKSKEALSLYKETYDCTIPKRALFVKYWEEYIGAFEKAEYNAARSAHAWSDAVLTELVVGNEGKMIKEYAMKWEFDVLAATNMSYILDMFVTYSNEDIDELVKRITELASNTT